MVFCVRLFFFFFQAEDGIRDRDVTGVQTCALPIWPSTRCSVSRSMVIATLTLLMDLSPWYDNISYPPETPGEIPLAARATPLTRGSRRNRGFRGIIPTLL